MSIHPSLLPSSLHKRMPFDLCAYRCRGLLIIDTFVG